MKSFFRSLKKIVGQSRQQTLSNDLNKLISDLEKEGYEQLPEPLAMDTRQKYIDSASKFKHLLQIVEFEEKHCDHQTREAFDVFLIIFNLIKVPFFLPCEGKLPTHAYSGDKGGSAALLLTLKGLDQGIYDPHRPIEKRAGSANKPPINHSSKGVRPVIPYPVTHLLMVYGLNRSLTLSIKTEVESQLKDIIQRVFWNENCFQQLVSSWITELEKLYKPSCEFNWFCLASRTQQASFRRRNAHRANEHCTSNSYPTVKRCHLEFALCF